MASPKTGNQANKSSREKDKFVFENKVATRASTSAILISLLMGNTADNFYFYSFPRLVPSSLGSKYTGRQNDDTPREDSFFR